MDAQAAANLREIVRGRGPHPSVLALLSKSCGHCARQLEQLLTMTDHTVVIVPTQFVDRAVKVLRDAGASDLADQLLGASHVPATWVFQPRRNRPAAAYVGFKPAAALRAGAPSS